MQRLPMRARKMTQRPPTPVESRLFSRNGFRAPGMIYTDGGTGTVLAEGGALVEGPSERRTSTTWSVQ